MARRRGRRVVSLVVVGQGAGRRREQRRGGGDTGHRRRRDRHPAALAQTVDHWRLAGIPRHFGRLQRDCSSTDDGRSVSFWNTHGPAQALLREGVGFLYTRWKRGRRWLDGLAGWLGSSGRAVDMHCMYVSVGGRVPLPNRHSYPDRA
jgi:hypothetical protein